MVVVTQTMEVEVASINHKDRARKQACVVGFVKRAVAIHGALLKNILFFKGFTISTIQRASWHYLDGTGCFSYPELTLR